MDEPESEFPRWWIFRGGKRDPDRIKKLPGPPPWRAFTPEARRRRGQVFFVRPQEIELVNTALYLRRPLLVTGKPGTGKSSLAYAVAEELGLGPVLYWPITTRTTLADGLYRYDALARLQDFSLAQEQHKEDEPGAIGPPGIGHYIRLGPLGTAFQPEDSVRPRVLLIDEIDKSDIDLPNDLLHLFEEGEFEIPELARLPEEERYRCVDVLTHSSEERMAIERGKVRLPDSQVFPFVVMTSNEEREFPPAFLRRCIRLDVQQPTLEELQEIVERHLSFDPKTLAKIKRLIKKFDDLRQDGRQLATDQLLNSVYLLFREEVDTQNSDKLREALFRSLSVT